MWICIFVRISTTISGRYPVEAHLLLPLQFSHFIPRACLSITNDCQSFGVEQWIGWKSRVSWRRLILAKKALSTHQGEYELTFSSKGVITTNISA